MVLRRGTDRLAGRSQSKKTVAALVAVLAVPFHFPLVIYRGVAVAARSERPAVMAIISATIAVADTLSVLPRWFRLLAEAGVVRRLPRQHILPTAAAVAARCNWSPTNLSTLPGALPLTVPMVWQAKTSPEPAVAAAVLVVGFCWLQKKGYGFPVWLRCRRVVGRGGPAQPDRETTAGTAARGASELMAKLWGIYPPLQPQPTAGRWFSVAVRCKPRLAEP